MVIFRVVSDNTITLTTGKEIIERMKEMEEQERYNRIKKSRYVKYERI